MDFRASQKLIQMAIQAQPAAEVFAGGEIGHVSGDRAFVDLAIKEGVAGFLFRHLKNNETADQISDADRLRLEQIYYASVRKNMRLQQALSEIIEQAAQSDIRVVLLQGISLLDCVYSDIGLRALTDLDLWILPENFSGLSDCMSRLGYEHRKPYRQVFVRDDICVDIHTHLLWAERIQTRSSLLHLSQAEIFNAAESQRLEGGIAYRLNPADQFVYLALHCLKHFAQRLIWLVDLVFLIRPWTHAEWASLRQRASELGQMRTVQYLLYLLEDLAAYRPPQECLDLFTHPPLKAWEKGILQIRKEKNQLPVWAPLVLLPANLSPARKAGFVFENLFPGPPVLRQIFSSRPELKNWQLYGLRVLQLMGLKKPD